jgi:hypothetical protein
MGQNSTEVKDEKEVVSSVKRTWKTKMVKAKKDSSIVMKEVECNCFIFCTFKSDHLEFLYTFPKFETVF